MTLISPTYPLDVFLSYRDKGNNMMLPQSIINYNNKRKIIKDNQAPNWRQYDSRAKNKFMTARSSQPDADKLSDAIRTRLNKLARDNFNEIVKELLTLPITTLENINELVDAIINKAIFEKLYSPIYAKLCNEFVPYVIVSGSTNAKISFKDVLISKCQTLYNSYIKQQSEANKEKKIGFMMFLSYLYIEKVITYTIINSCITCIIRNHKTITDSIEMISSMMKVIGQKIHEENKKDAVGNMKILKDLVDGKTLPIREKFMIMDVLDLAKNNNW